MLVCLLIFTSKLSTDLWPIPRQGSMHSSWSLSRKGQLLLLAFPTCLSWRAYIPPVQHSSPLSHSIIPPSSKPYSCTHTSSSFCLFSMLCASAERHFREAPKCANSPAYVESFPHKAVYILLYMPIPKGVSLQLCCFADSCIPSISITLGPLPCLLCSFSHLQFFTQLVKTLLKCLRDLLSNSIEKF